jgi:hypothetical protein
LQIIAKKCENIKKDKMKSFVCLIGLAVLAVAAAFPAETIVESEVVAPVKSVQLEEELKPVVEAVVSAAHENETARKKRFIGIGIGGLGGYGGYGGYGGGYGGYGGYPGYGEFIEDSQKIPIRNFSEGRILNIFF